MDWNRIMLSVALTCTLLVSGMWLVTWSCAHGTRDQMGRLRKENARLTDENERLKSHDRLAKVTQDMLRVIPETADKVVEKLSVRREELSEGDKEFLRQLFDMHKDASRRARESKQPQGVEKK